MYVFTKLLVPHRQYLRSRGVRLNMFIDDQRVLGESAEKCLEDNRLANETFEKAGWTISVSKSSEIPVQRMKFLGLDHDTLVMKYFVPKDKVDSIKELILEILNLKKVHIKVLAKLLGKVQFCYKACGPSIRLLCRSSYKQISEKTSWNCFINLSERARRELLFLYENFDNLNGFPLRPSRSQVKIDLSISSDASDIGFCVYQVACENMILLRDSFNEFEANKSSTARELLAFHRFYCSEKAEFLKNCNIVHYTDNHNCAVILTIGSRNVDLQPLVLDIFIRWRNLNLKVEVVHLSRENPIIQYADFESRNFDLTDFSIDYDNFLYIVQRFGLCKLDCFASFSNKKCDRYYSKFFDEASEGVNFFAQNLPNVDLYLFPPVQLIIPSLLHLEKFYSFGVFVMPIWKSAQFWPFVCEDGKHLNKFVDDFFIFSPYFISGEFVKNDMFKGYKKFDTLVFRFSFKILDNFTSNKTKKFCILNGCNDCF